MNVIRLRLPRLSDRREDVPMLTRHFLQQSAKQLGVEPKRISDTAIAQLMHFPFPGNVRQLENICHWLTVMAPAQVIEPKDLPPEIAGALVEPGRPLPATDHVVHAAAVADAESAPTVGSRAVVAVPAGPLPDAPASTGPAVTLLPVGGWEGGLEAEAQILLASGREDVWDVLSRRFESKLILTALANTRGRRIEAAQKLGIGRNTITRKIQELHLE